MAALPYIQLYVADYLADTMHLTTEEHGAYLLIIFNYWQTGKPIPKNRLARIARLSNDRWSSVELSLSEFFNDTGTEWQHTRIDMDLESVNGSLSQKSAAGKASAEARKRKKAEEAQRNVNETSTTVEIPLQRNVNETSTNKDTDTDTDTELNTLVTFPSDEPCSEKNQQVENSDSENLIPEKQTSEKPKNCPTQKIIDLYHETLPELPRMLVITEQRKTLIAARWKQSASMQSLERWKSFFNYVRESDFLMGRTEKPFFADLEFLTTAGKFAKVVEGKYHAK